MEHDVWIAIISGLTATAVPTVGILIVWLQDKAQFASINQRFDDMRELWRAELRRFEEGLDARLKRLEEDEREHEANLPTLVCCETRREDRVTLWRRGRAHPRPVLH
jgi:hypothetical protein